jgi:hypothetical protein
MSTLVAILDGRAMSAPDADAPLPSSSARLDTPRLAVEPA